MHGAIVVPSFVGEGGGVRLKLNVQGEEGGKILNVDGDGGGGILKIRKFSWTSYMYRSCRISYFSCKIFPFIYIIWEKIVFERFCS